MGPEDKVADIDTSLIELAFAQGSHSIACPRVSGQNSAILFVAPDISLAHLRIIDESELSDTTELGRGGFGVVYKGKLKSIDEDSGNEVFGQVAIKSVLNGGDLTPEQVRTEQNKLNH